MLASQRSSRRTRPTWTAWRWAASRAGCSSREATTAKSTCGPSASPPASWSVDRFHSLLAAFSFRLRTGAGHWHRVASASLKPASLIDPRDGTRGSHSSISAALAAGPSTAIVEERRTEISRNSSRAWRVLALRNALEAQEGGAPVATDPTLKFWWRQTLRDGLDDEVSRKKVAARCASRKCRDHRIALENTLEVRGQAS